MRMTVLVLGWVLLPAVVRADLIAHTRATSVNGGCAVDDHEGFGQGDPDRTLRMAIFDSVAVADSATCATDCSDDGNPATADGKTLDYCTQSSSCGAFDFPDQLLEKVIPDNSGAYFYFGLWDMDLDANDSLGDHWLFASTRTVLSGTANNNASPYSADSPIAGMCYGFSDGGDVEGGGNVGNYTLNQVSWFTDTSGPSNAVVFATDDALTNPAWDNDTMLNFNWTGAADPNSGIDEYLVTLRNVGTGAVLFNLATVGTATSVSFCPSACTFAFTPVHGTTYGLVVRAFNGAYPTLTTEAGGDARSVSISAERTIAVDLTNPVSSVTAPAAASWVNASFTATLADSDLGAGLTSCAYTVVDNGTVRVNSAARTCSTGVSITVGAGSNCRTQGATTCTVEVTSVDGARRNSAVGTRSFSVDWTEDDVVGLAAWTANGGTVISPVGWTVDRDPYVSWGINVGGRHAPITGYSWLWDADPDCSAELAGGDSGALQTSTGTLLDGAHTFRIRAVDAAGNCGPVATLAINVDGSAESLGPLTVRGGPGGAVIAPATWQMDDTVYVEWTAPTSTAPVFGYSYAVNATADCLVDVLTNAWDLTATALGNGASTLQVRAVDAAGNCGAAANTAVWVDQAQDAITSITVRNGAGQPAVPLGEWLAVTTPYLEWTTAASISPITGYSWSTNGAPDCVVDAPAANVTLPALSNGTVTFQVRAVDAAGNCGPVLTRELLVDGQAEPITGLAAYEFQSGPIIPAATWQPLNRPHYGWSVPASASPLAGYSFAVDAAADCVVDTALPRVTPPALTDGVHVFEVRAVDTAGNCGQAASFTVWVDAAGDDVTGLAAWTDLGGASIPSATWTTDNTPYMTWSATSVSPLAGYSVAVAGSVDCVVDTNTAAYAVAALPDGFHKVTVRAVDAAGNCGAAVSYDLYVDRTADALLDLRLEAASGGAVPSGVWQPQANVVAFFQATSQSPVTGYSFGLDAAADCLVDTVATSLALGVLGQGMHRLEVRALDSAGNCGPVGTLDIWVDAAAEDVGPVMALSDVGGTTLPAGTWQLDDTVVFVWGAVTSTAPVQYSVALDAPADCTGDTALPQHAVTLMPGQHVFHVRAVDAAGNCGAEQTFALWVDGDTDADNIGAQQDNCPAAFNPDQLNTDGDAQGDACDPDDDGDTLLDARELVLGLNPQQRDSDGDAIPDNVEVVDPVNPRDTNNDQMLDALDDDSDGDGLSDADEAGDTDLDTPAVDRNANQIPDYRDALSDADGDGVPDAQEVGDVDLVTPPVNTDNNGLPDYLDDDSDDDGVLDGVDNCRTVANPDQASAADGGPGLACAPPTPDAGAVMDASTPQSDGGVVDLDGGPGQQDASANADASLVLDGAIGLDGATGGDAATQDAAIALDAAMTPDASALDAAVPPPDGGAGRLDASFLTRDAAVTTPGEPGEDPGEQGGGCGCQTSQAGLAPVVAWLGGVVLLLRRRRR